jgi:hypothetical protein
MHVEVQTSRSSCALRGVTTCEATCTATESHMLCCFAARQGVTLIEQLCDIAAPFGVYSLSYETVMGIKIIPHKINYCIGCTCPSGAVMLLNLQELVYREYLYLTNNPVYIQLSSSTIKENQIGSQKNPNSIATNAIHLMTFICETSCNREKEDLNTLQDQDEERKQYSLSSYKHPYDVPLPNSTYVGQPASTSGSTAPKPRQSSSFVDDGHSYKAKHKIKHIFTIQYTLSLLVIHITIIIAVEYTIVYITFGKRLGTAITRNEPCIGGGSAIYTFQDLKDYFIEDKHHENNERFKYERYILENVYINENRNDQVYACKIPVRCLSAKLPITELKHISACHNIFVSSKARISYIRSVLENHKCESCAPYVAVFTMINKSKVLQRKRTKNFIAVKKYRQEKHNKYQLTELSALLRRHHGINSIHKIAELAAIKKYMQDQDVMSEQQSITFPKKDQTRHMQRYKYFHAESLKKCKIECKNPSFPPEPAGFSLIHKIVTNACNDLKDANISEKGCAVCGCLTLISNLTLLEKADVDLNMLMRSGVTRKERTNADQPIEEINGPIMDNKLDSICNLCHKSMSNQKIPLMALVNGNWLGEIPSQLRNLSFAEQLLISRVRHNYCIVRVSSGMRKMRANAISFANPTLKIYNILPPPKEELEEILAIIYTGPCKPTKKDLQRTPLLVRRNKVKLALEWLKLNHCDYEDLEVSHEHLNQYPDNDIPVFVDYRELHTNKEPEATAVNDMNDEEGTEQGMCPFVVHGLTGDEYTKLSTQALKTIALKHLTGNKNILAIGHASKPESIYDNSKLFPRMMPWLFPYGFGGVGNQMQRGRISDIAHKRYLLLYHDKRFQMDPHFPLIAFNHEQIKQCTSAGFLLAKKTKFADISERILSINISTIERLAKRMEDGEKIIPETVDEKTCFQLIKDLDHVGGYVKGSITSKKYMRNELWSLISFQGAPSWFITFAPADNKHPICLYFADTQEVFNPNQMRDHDTRYRLIANNPVAGARFFHFMCQQFIKHVLGVGEDHRGIYGDTTAYYGTVEQQGRLTLHLHLLLWVNTSLSPQEVRNRIMDPSSDFQQKMIRYLESVHVGEFLTGSMTDVEIRVRENSHNEDYRNPTETLPEQPPPLCDIHNNNDTACTCLEEWYDKFKNTVDDLIFRSNVHSCRKSPSDGKGPNKNQRPLCLNKHGNCKARFPRKKYSDTTVDSKTGALTMKKLEEWINTLTPALTYIIRCNSDVTSLLSGTAIKAVVAYVSDYITKNGLNTYSIFEAIRRILERNSELIGGNTEQREKARQLITKIVNTLTSKMEIGSPMASLYLLGNPDHYTSHKFITIYWRNFVREALKPWQTTGNTENDNDIEKVVLIKKKDTFIGLSSVHDYIYRPQKHEDVSLYEWSQMAKRVKGKKKPKQKNKIENPKYIKTLYNVTSDDIVECDSNGIFNKDMIDYEDDIDKQTTDIDDIEESLIDTDFNTDDENNVLFEDGHEQKRNQRRCSLIQVDHFHEEHPLHSSHVAHFNPSKTDVVLNFVGGSLPRRDRGDREYYCATMLTLFKSWRNGKDLKSETSSWHETFTNHNFTARQNKLMDNFNLRYECNDARDDYSAQLKKNNLSNTKLPVWLMSEELGDESITEFEATDQHDDDGTDEEEEYRINKYAGISLYGEFLQSQMKAAANSVINAGWLDNSPDGLHCISTVPIQPETEILGNKWKAVVQEKKEEIINMRNTRMVRKIAETNMNSIKFDENEVRIVNQSYLTCGFRCESNDVHFIMDETVKQFKLNTEQERAFRIVANHASNYDNEQLKMYVGGMGGTGKSRVIEALKRYFDCRGESWRLLILGPTGTSAALLGGSTYHSVLGIHVGESRNEARTIMQVKTKLEGVDYIFIDEISMVSCHHLYTISAQLAKALGNHQKPFGGMNMIFAGDFAQLPPVGGAALYSESVGTRLDSSSHLTGQQSAIGKALWHQVTTVVILRENMRQKNQTNEDASLRKALTNMRYGACTKDDIEFLNTRIAGRRSDQPKVASKDFRNIAIICGRHTEKDMINQLGCERFAADTNQTLVHFYSVDKWARNRKNNKTKRSSSEIHDSEEIDLDDQHEIWKLHPGRTDHFPGRLPLCLGMPVIIKHNYATELCMTNGQEGTVVGWQASQGIHGTLTLDTLFVKLDNPPQPIKLNGLPDNVVPIVKVTQTIICRFLNDLTESIERQQVYVQLNFAMTAHASQGKTRPHNIAHLNSCRDHMAYYTALSRSASASGTIIIQGFSEHVITKPCSGWLRQEFREQEILDDITAIRYGDKLPSHISGKLRNDLLRQYQSWKSTGYTPEKTDHVLRWSPAKPMSLIEEVIDSEWQLITKKKDAKISVEKTENDFTPPVLTPKRKNKDPTLPVEKRKKVTHSSASDKQNIIQPIGLIWDENNYSCSYDSLILIIYHIWIRHTMIWTDRLLEINSDYLRILVDGFTNVIQARTSLENTRDNLRHLLYERHPRLFPMGRNYASVGDLASHIFGQSKSISYVRSMCSHCQHVSGESIRPVTFVNSVRSGFAGTASDWMMQRTHTTRYCPSCGEQLMRISNYVNVPSILIFEHVNEYDLDIQKSIQLTVAKQKTNFSLRGMIYFGGYHFTSRVISLEGNVWYNDGMITGRRCIQGGNFDTLTNENMRKYRGRGLRYSIYTKQE